MSETISTRVKAMIAKQLGVNEDDLSEQAQLEEDLRADSLDQVEIAMMLEEDFGIEIPDEEAAKIRTVADAVAFVEKHAVAGEIRVK